MTQMLDSELPTEVWDLGEPPVQPDPASVRRRAVIAVLLLTGLFTIGILLLLVGSALGSGAPGGCGGG